MQVKNKSYEDCGGSKDEWSWKIRIIYKCGRYIKEREYDRRERLVRNRKGWMEM